jgi:gamma-glutamyltranspeptidase/glutathione hydrolase/leukotriene-C4 hydrolase
LKNPKLAETLQIIANEGVDAIYGENGTLGVKMVEEIQSHGGLVTLDDLWIYQPKWSRSVSTKLYQGNILYAPTLPSSGSVLAFILNILEGYNFHENTFEYHRENKLIYHRIIEAFKFGFAMRTKLGDELSPEVAHALRDITNVEFANHIRTKINDTTTYNDINYYGANGTVKNDYGTGHISILSPNGDAISLTATINSM